ncbi:MAG TPA: hypothetical protein PLX33_02725 [Alphaproteobacteria bacterium]|nr:hypothetical protein [Alphaproteobacteria bacterium]
MGFESIEGVHYIFDRYAFLNSVLSDAGKEKRLDENASAKEIREACTLARAMYHPDRQARSGEKMKREAERMTSLVGDCEKMLLNADLKPLYDEKLAQFRAESPRAVSENGTPIIDMSRTVFDVASLISDDIVDTSDFEARVKAMLQYDDKRAEQMKTLFDTMPDNAQVSTLYRDALTQKLVYLTLLEDAAWAKLGYMNRKEKDGGIILRTEDYMPRLDRTLEEAAAKDIPAAVEKHGNAARLGIASIRLIEAFNPAADSAPADSAENEIVKSPARLREALDKAIAKAQQNFTLRAEYVRDVARQKLAVLDQLVTLTPVRAVGQEQKDQQAFDFYLLNPEENGQQTVLFRMAIDVKTGRAEPPEMGEGNTIADVEKTANLRAGFAVTRNPEISDIMLEIGAAADRFLATRSTPEPENAATAPKPPKPRTP